MTDCTCGKYLSYRDYQKGKGLFSALMTMDSCINCYLLKRYNTLDREKIKMIKIEEAKNSLENNLNRMLITMNGKWKMKLKIEDYLVKINNENGKEIIVLFFDNNDIKDFYFNKSSFIISKSKKNKKQVFILSEDKSILCLDNIEIKHINIISKQKEIEIYNVDQKGKFVSGFKLDIKIIK